jgi:sodium/potassium-transporting ATPase subunit alpha
MGNPFTEKIDLENQKDLEVSKAIRFEEADNRITSRSQDIPLKRVNSASSQNIIAYRTLSITISEHEAKRGVLPSRKRKFKFFGKKTEAVEGTCAFLFFIHLSCHPLLILLYISITDIAYTNFHKHSVDEVLQQFSTSEKIGLDSQQVSKRLSRDGKNKISPPPSDWARKLFTYFFGGFCSLLWFASIICW